MMTIVRRVRRMMYGAASALALLVVAGCVNVFWRTEVKPVELPQGDALTSVAVPLKAHLVDGRTVVFPDGAVISRQQLVALEGPVGTDTQYVGLKSVVRQRRESTRAREYALLDDIGTPVHAVAMSSVVAVEAFEPRVNAAQTVVVSAAATVLGTLATAGLAVALFGSCPTVYADASGGPVLQAEGFSYSIGPLFEKPDLDLLRVRPAADGTVRLELRNEALETHYINHVALIAARHEPGASVVPDQRGNPVAVEAMRPLSRAVDRAGRNVRDVLATADGNLYSTAASVLAAVRPGDFDDYIDLDATNLPPGDSVAVVLRLRNSLLNTVLLYDGMLGGPAALNWLAGDLNKVPAALELGRWYGSTMGMRATLVAPVPMSVHLSDVGPIAFRDVAIVLPRPARNASRVRVRLSFVADNWRIDQAGIAAVVSRPQSTVMPLSAVLVPTPETGGGPMQDTAAQHALAAVDARYLQTIPGQRMTLEFATGLKPDEPGVTYLLSWQGWYREWVRGEWMAKPTRSERFVPGDAALMTALTKWRERQESFERAFYASRLPVR
jgi:hypothetical protein